MKIEPQVPVRWHGDVAVVGAVGAFTDVWPPLRRELQLVLGSQPRALLLDMTECTSDQGTSFATMLSELEWHARAWSGLSIVLCGQPFLSPRAGAGDLGVARTVDAALAALRERPAPDRVLVDLPPDPRSAADGRHAAQHALTRWDARADDLTLLVSELVTNAVVHAEGWVELSLARHEHHLRVAVRDGSPAAPQGQSVVPEASGGRGLGLVQALSHAWGTLPARDGGKVVWCTLHTTPAATAAGAS